MSLDKKYLWAIAIIAVTLLLIFGLKGLVGALGAALFGVQAHTKNKTQKELLAQQRRAEAHRRKVEQMERDRVEAIEREQARTEANLNDWLDR